MSLVGMESEEAMEGRYDVLVTLDLTEQRKLEEVTKYFKKICPNIGDPTPSTIFGALLELTHMRVLQAEIISAVFNNEGREIQA